jgi:hypothetical protein
MAVSHKKGASSLSRGGGGVDLLKPTAPTGVEARGSSMSTALGGTTKGRSKNLATPPTQPE